MSIKLLAVDLDGTLFDENHELPQETRLLLQEVMAQGVLVTPVTGRIFPSALRVSLKICSNAPLICCNGSIVQLPFGKSPLYLSCVPQHLVRGVVDFCHERNLYLQMYHGNDIVVEEVTEKTLADPDYHNTGCWELGDFTTAELPETPKMMIYDTPEKIIELRQILREMYGEELYMAQSKDYLLEMMAMGTNKATALQWLANYLGLESSEVMACGDNSNDIEMIKWAGIGVSMGNGIPELKAAADYVSEGQYSAGVREAIRKFILK